MLFAVLGAAAVVGGRGYPVGSPSNMGPGFFPVVLGGLLCVLGLCNAAMARGGRTTEGSERIGFGRSLMLPVAVVAFGVLVERAGVIAATLALVLCVWAAGFGFRLWEILVVAVMLVLIACGLFLYGLQLPSSYLLPS